MSKQEGKALSRITLAKQPTVEVLDVDGDDSSSDGLRTSDPMTMKFSEIDKETG